MVEPRQNESRAVERLRAPQEPTAMVDWWGAEEVVPRPARLGGALRAPADTAKCVAEEDLRTLWIDRDDQGQRFKDWKVCSESAEERQADSTVAGPPSCLTVCNHMQHHGGNPKLWMHLWMKELVVSAKDRLYHEVSTLVEVPYQGGKYDQSMRTRG